MDLHAPGVDTRGVTSAPFPGYMLIGRGPDFAWTLTSAGADNIDQYVEELCEGSDIRYRYKGRCRSMSTFVAGTIAATATQPEQLVVFRRTKHGPVIGYAKVDGRRVAISQKRASYGRDTLDQLPFQDLTLGKVRQRPLVRALVPAVAPDVQRLLRRRPRHRHGHHGPAAAARPRRRPRPADARATASTSGAAGCRTRGTPSRSTRAAGR